MCVLGLARWVLTLFFLLREAGAPFSPRARPQRCIARGPLNKQQHWRLACHRQLWVLVNAAVLLL